MAANATPGEFSPLPTTREERGRQIAQLGGIHPLGASYVVPSQSVRAGAPPTYLVDLVEQTCTCPDYELRRLVCKHQEAVLFWLARFLDGSTILRPAQFIGCGRAAVEGKNNEDLRAHDRA